jgi:hypothetical protein
VLRNVTDQDNSVVILVLKPIRYTRCNTSQISQYNVPVILVIMAASRWLLLDVVVAQGRREGGHKIVIIPGENHGMCTADGLLKSGVHKRALVIGGW